MPQMANIVVKKYDGATDVTFTAIQPSGGDKSPAVWRDNASGTAIAHRTQLTLQSVMSGSRAVRRVIGSFNKPVVATVDGLPKVIHVVRGNFEFHVPLEAPETDLNEAAAQMGNLIDSALVQECLRTGQSAS